MYSPLKHRQSRATAQHARLMCVRFYTYNHLQLLESVVIPVNYLQVLHIFYLYLN